MKARKWTRVARSISRLSRKVGGRLIRSSRTVFRPVKEFPSNLRWAINLMNEADQQEAKDADNRLLMEMLGIRGDGRTIPAQTPVQETRGRSPASGRHAATRPTGRTTTPSVTKPKTKRKRGSVQVKSYKRGTQTVKAHKRKKSTNGHQKHRHRQS